MKLYWQRPGPLASLKRGLPLSEKVAHGPVCAASSEGSTPEGHFYSVPVPERESNKNPTDPTDLVFMYLFPFDIICPFSFYLNF